MIRHRTWAARWSNTPSSDNGPLPVTQLKNRGRAKAIYTKGKDAMRTCRFCRTKVEDLAAHYGRECEPLRVAFDPLYWPFERTISAATLQRREAAGRSARARMRQPSSAVR